MSELIGYVSLISDPVNKLLWIKELSYRSGLSTKEINVLVKTPSVKNVNTITTSVATPKKKLDPMCKNLIMTMLAEPRLSLKFFDDDWSQYVPEGMVAIVHEIKNAVVDRDSLDVSDWMNISRRPGCECIETLLTKGIADKKIDFMNAESDFIACVTRFKINHLELLKRDLLKKIKDWDKTENTLREHQAIIKEIEALKPALGVRGGTAEGRI